MKARILVLMIGITLLAVLAAPIRPAAQEQRQQSERAGSPDTGTTNPVPLINQPLVPDAVAPGGPGFILTINGTGFVPGSVVNWNGSALATTFVSGSQLTASVPAGDLVAAATASITVVNPTPGGGTSNVAFFTVTQASSTVAFSGPAYATGATPEFLLAADFNGDGKLDLCTGNQATSTVSILLGNGDGTFQPHVDQATSQPPAGMVAGDFNHDGKFDLALTNQFLADTVSILLGNGDGTFKAAVDYATGTVPIWLTEGDFNGDGNLDLAVADFGEFDGATVSILLGNADGTFQSHVEYATGALPRSVTIGDFNRDGKLDLALPNQGDNSISILLGNGDGTFQTHVDYAVAPTAQVAAVGDFNEDGKLDLAVSADGGNTVSVLLGNGDGTFQNYVQYAVRGSAFYVPMADFNGDGHLDLATSNGDTNTVSVLLGNGNGTFQPYSDYATGLSPAGVAVGDFNGDGRLDLAVSNRSANTVSILLQVTGPVAVLSPTSLNFGTQLVGTASAGQTVTLSNPGISTLDISSIAASTHFLEGSTCGSSLAAGASCTIHVKFRPSGIPGTETGTLTVTDNAPGSPQTVSLTGVGTAVSLSATSVNFGNQPVGTTSGPQTVTLTNHAKGTLSIFVVGITGANASDFAQTNTCGGSVTAGSSCTFSITFTPGAKGNRTATLNIRDDGGASPQAVTLIGTGT